MKLCSICVLSVLVAAFAGLSIAAPQEDLVEELRVDLEVWVEAVSDFIGEVSFDEADMRSFLDLYPELAVLMDDEAAIEEENWDDEGWNEGEDASLAESFQEVINLLGDPRYLSWAAENGLNAEDWMHKAARILILSQGTMMGEYFEMADAQRQEQVGDLEAQREQLGEEMYAAMQASAEMMKLTREAWDDLPRPTAAEEQLIADHMDEISQLIGMDEGDEWGAP